MAIKLYLSEVDRTDHLRPDTCRISRAANGASDMSLTLLADYTATSPPATYRPVRGEVIKVSDGESPETVWFEGNISRIIETRPGKADVIQFALDARDYNHIAVRRIISGCYENMSQHDIVLRMVETGFSGEGITTTNVEDTSPPVTIVERLVFSYETMKSAFDRICAITGYVWWIDSSKDLHFVLPTATAAPFNITDDSGDWIDFEVEHSDEDYRNRQHVRSELTIAKTAGTATGEFPWTATAGANQIPTRAVTAEVISITVDAVAKTFIRVEEDESDPVNGYDFFYRPNWCGVRCLDIGNFIGGEVCSVEYRPGYNAWQNIEDAPQGTGPQVVTKEDTAEQAARAVIEGGSGIWEAVEEQRWLGTAAALEAIADGRLRQYAVDAEKIRYRTHKDGLSPGQQQHITNTPHQIDGDYFIERIESEWKIGADDFWWHTVYATSAEPYGQAVGLLERLIEMARIGPMGALAPAVTVSAPSAFINFPCSPPLSSMFSWVNQGAATAEDQTGGLFFSSPGVGSQSLAILDLAVSAPYTITVVFIPRLFAATSTGAGLCFRESSSGKVIEFRFGGEGNFGVCKFNSPTSYNSAYVTVGALASASYMIWMRIKDDGTDRKCYMSSDGANWYEVHTIGRTDFLTADRAGICLYRYNATWGPAALLVHWTMT